MITRHDAFIPFIKAVGRGEKLKRDLTYDEAVAAMSLILRREATDAQIGAFLIAQRVKGEAPEEIRGFTDAVRERFIEPITPRVGDLLDLAVPYDGKAKTAQLAPAVALILVAAGVPVLLHGAAGVPTKQGVTLGALLRVLGVAADLPPVGAARMIEQAGITYLDACQFAPAWNALTPLRRQFGLRTALNTVEKLFNPAAAPYQVSGFFHANYIERIRAVQTGGRASWIVQGEEGSIEMAAGRRTPVYAVDAADDLTLDPAVVGLAQRERIELPPDVADHARLNAAVLAGEAGAAADQAAFTAGVILSLLGAASDPAAGTAQARQILASGAAQQRLDLARSFQ